MGLEESALLIEARRQEKEGQEECEERKGSHGDQKFLAATSILGETFMWLF